MEKETKMYSSEIVDKAVSTAVMGFTLSQEDFEKSVKELPREIQALVLASVLAGHITIHSKMNAILSKAKLKGKPTKEDVDKIFDEAFRKMARE